MNFLVQRSVGFDSLCSVSSRPFRLSVTPDVTSSHKKRERQLGLFWAQAAEAFTASSRLAKVVFSRSRSIALCAEVNTFSRVSRMQCPTGHSVLGFREGLLNVSATSTALYTSAKLMRPGDRFNREPGPAPLQVSTSFARCKASRSRRTITGFVLTLLASMADVTRSPSLYARTLSTCTAMANRQLVLIA